MASRGDENSMTSPLLHAREFTRACVVSFFLERVKVKWMQIASLKSPGNPNGNMLAVMQ